MTDENRDFPPPPPDEVNPPDDMDPDVKTGVPVEPDDDPAGTPAPEEAPE